MQLVIDIPEDVLKRTVFYREFRELNDLITTIKALEKAVPLPKGHGKLVDVEDVKDNIRKWRGYLDEDMMYRINFAMEHHIPTIIGADKESDNNDT